MTPEKRKSMIENFGVDITERIEQTEKRTLARRKRAASPIVSEAATQKAILQWLNLNGIFSWRQNTQGQIRHTSGNAAIMTSSFSRGCPDILGILPNGRSLMIEVKSSAWKAPSQQALERAHIRWARESKRDPYETYRAQAAFQSKARINGALVILARSLSDVTAPVSEYLRTHCQPLPTRA